jgi:hypothetical protein
MRTLVEQSRYCVEIQEYLVAGSLELFQRYGLAVGHADGAPGVNVVVPSVMAVIGYAATTVRGSLLLLTSRPVAAALRPPELRDEPPTEALCCATCSASFATCSSAA